MYQYFILVCCCSEVKEKRKVHFEFSPQPRFRISPKLINITASSKILYFVIIPPRLILYPVKESFFNMTRGEEEIETHSLKFYRFYSFTKAYSRKGNKWVENSKKMVIFTVVCCHGNSLHNTHMHEKEIPGVLLIFTVKLPEA